MILDIVFSVLLAWLFYQQHVLKNKINKINETKCNCEDKGRSKDPYKDWRDPNTGLLKSRKNTFL